MRSLIFTPHDCVFLRILQIVRQFFSFTIFAFLMENDKVSGRGRREIVIKFESKVSHSSLRFSNWNALPASASEDIFESRSSLNECAETFFF